MTKEVVSEGPEGGRVVIVHETPEERTERLLADDDELDQHFALTEGQWRVLDQAREAARTD